MSGKEEKGGKTYQLGDDGGLYDALCTYAKGDSYPYHMPGHKRNGRAGVMAPYYEIDITEIDGFDNLHQSEGILRDAQERANRLYGAEETFYLVNGSTCGVLAAVMSAAGRGEELLVARNCHKSVYHGAVLQGLQVHYCYPSILPEYGIYDGIAAAEIKRLLEKYPASKAVVLTSPTYEGIISDIKAIAAVVHERNKILIVDEAHGAHLGLEEHMPPGAVTEGADLVIHSLHKTLPSMTQTALLHVQGRRVDRSRLRRYLRILQTSSPSYVMMASMDCCIRYVEKHRAEGFEFLRRQHALFCEKTEKCTYITVGKMEDLQRKSSIKDARMADSGQAYHLAAWDIGKLVIFVQNCSWNGRRLYDILREEYHLQMEMAAGNYVVAIMTIMDSEEGWQRLADALVQIDGRIEEEEQRRGIRQSTEEGSRLGVCRVRKSTKRNSTENDNVRQAIEAGDIDKSKARQVIGESSTEESKAVQIIEASDIDKSKVRQALGENCADESKYRRAIEDNNTDLGKTRQAIENDNTDQSKARQTIADDSIDTDENRERQVQPQIGMIAEEAFFSAREEVPLEEASGRITADFINLYPPGIPLLVPGEIINDSVIGHIRESIRIGLQVQGVSAEGKVSVCTVKC